MEKLGAGAATPLESATLRASLLACGLGGCVTQDIVDCATRLAATGEADGARALLDLVCLRMGFSPGARASHAAVADHGGALSVPAVRQEAAAAGVTDTSDLVLAELKALSTLLARDPARNDGSWHPLPRAGLAWGLHALCDALRQPLGDPEASRLDGLLAHLRAEVLDRPPVALGEHAASIAALALHLAVHGLRAFLDAHVELAYAPYGSARLFHATAQLGSAGLGPYLGNVAQYAAGARDVVALAHLAAANDGPQGAHDALVRWIVLLSFDVANIDLVDQLADMGLLQAIEGIAARAIRLGKGRTDPGLLWSLRDAALDYGDYDLAVRMQRDVVRHRRDNSVEWSVLGEIEGSAAHFAEAEAAFETSLRLDPGHADGRAHLEAVRQRNYDGLRLLGGFGTSPRRRAIRRAARHRLRGDAARS